VPFILTFFLYQSDEIESPFFFLIGVVLFEGLGRNIPFLGLFPPGRPSFKDKKVPTIVVLALNQWCKVIRSFVSGNWDILEPAVDPLGHQVVKGSVCLEEVTGFSQFW
jgi:hypothetical protein